MGWLTKDNEGEKMEKRLNEIINSLGMLLLYLLFIYSVVLCWLAFNDRIKAVLLTAQNLIFG